MLATAPVPEILPIYVAPEPIRAASFGNLIGGDKDQRTTTVTTTNANSNNRYDSNVTSTDNTGNTTFSLGGGGGQAEWLPLAIAGAFALIGLALVRRA